MLDALFAKAGTPAFRLIALIVTFAMMCILSGQGAPLRNHHAPSGVVSLELAGTGKKAHEVVDSWKSPPLRRTAYWQVLLDFIFIAGYTALLIAVALSAQRAANAAGLTFLAWAGGLAAYGGLLAGIFDCLENIGLLAMLAGCINTPVAFLTSLFATVKFALAGVVVAIGLLTFVAA
ncbi:MAG: hypothetical protein WDO17_14380 [Alphaproteobacteria bacterium]